MPYVIFLRYILHGVCVRDEFLSITSLFILSVFENSLQVASSYSYSLFEFVGYNGSLSHIPIYNCKADIQQFGNIYWCQVWFISNAVNLRY